MFEMKYNKDGQPIKNQELATQASQNTEQPEEVSVEAQPQEVEQQEEIVQETQEEVSQQDDSRTNDKEENFKRLREKSEKLQRERDEALRLAEEMQKRYAKPQQEIKKEVPEEDTPFYINPDDLVEGKHLTQFEKKIKKLEGQLKQYQQHSEEIALEAQLKAQYPDFDEVVTPENIEQLKKLDPDIAEAIHYTPDLRKKANLAYKMIKKSGIIKEDNYIKDRELAQKNSNKPKPLTSISPQQGDTPLSRANAFAEGLTDDLRAQLRREMEEARKRM